VRNEVIAAENVEHVLEDGGREIADIGPRRLQLDAKERQVSGKVPQWEGRWEEKEGEKEKGGEKEKVREGSKERS
jgi:hypothetical protein